MSFRFTGPYLTAPLEDVLSVAVVFGFVLVCGAGLVGRETGDVAGCGDTLSAFAVIAGFSVAAGASGVLMAAGFCAVNTGGSTNTVNSRNKRPFAQLTSRRKFKNGSVIGWVVEIRT